MRYGFEVLVRGRTGQPDEWKRVRPTEGEPYVYDTQDEAERMRRMCYGAPEHAGKSRVVEVEE